MRFEKFLITVFVGTVIALFMLMLIGGLAELTR